MVHALLTLTLAAGVSSAPPPVAAVPPARTVNAAGVDRSLSEPAVMVTISRAKQHRAASEPPGYPLDADYVASIVQAIPRSGDGGG